MTYPEKQIEAYVLHIIFGYCLALHVRLINHLISRDHFDFQAQLSTKKKNEINACNNIKNLPEQTLDNKKCMHDLDIS